MFKKLLKIVEWVIFVALIGLFGVVVSPVLPLKNIPRTFIVVSGSMEPTIKTGSIVLTKPADAKTLKIGNIIAFTSPNNPKDTILHRITEIKSGPPLTFSTKGDNNNASDAWDVYGEGVRGIMVGAVPYLGHAAAFMRKPIGFGVMVGLPALVVIIWQILNIKKAIKEEIKKGVEKELSQKKIGGVIIFLGLMISAMMMKTAQAIFTDKIEVNGISISIKDFVPPDRPTLIAPANGTVRNTTGMVMDWSQVADFNNMNNPVYYIYQSSHNSGFAPLAYQSGKLSNSDIPAPGTPNGLYYWRVKACDAVDNCSEWSDVWSVTVDNDAPAAINLACINYSSQTPLTINWDPVNDFSGIEEYEIWLNGNSTNTLQTNWTINFGGEGSYKYKVRAKDGAGNFGAWSNECNLIYDKTLPISEITYPYNSNGDNEVAYVYLWNGKVKGKASDGLSGIDRVELSIHREYLDVYWNGSNWVKGTEQSVRVVAEGTNSWIYDFKNVIPLGKFRIVSHAVDKSGNMENSAVIEFINMGAAEAVETSFNSENNILRAVISGTNYQLDYEVIYSSGGIQKGVSGKWKESELTDGLKTYEIYLGNCSSSCIPDTIDEGKLSLRISGFVDGQEVNKLINF